MSEIKPLICSACGSPLTKGENDTFLCKYCDTIYVLQETKSINVMMMKLGEEAVRNMRVQMERDLKEELYSRKTMIDNLMEWHECTEELAIYVVDNSDINWGEIAYQHIMYNLPLDEINREDIEEYLKDDQFTKDDITYIYNRIGDFTQYAIGYAKICLENYWIDNRVDLKKELLDKRFTDKEIHETLYGGQIDFKEIACKNVRDSYYELSDDPEENKETAEDIRAELGDLDFTQEEISYAIKMFMAGKIQ